MLNEKKTVMIGTYIPPEEKDLLALYTFSNKKTVSKYIKEKVSETLAHAKEESCIIRAVKRYLRYFKYNRKEFEGYDESPKHMFLQQVRKDLDKTPINESHKSRIITEVKRGLKK